MPALLVLLLAATAPAASAYFQAGVVARYPGNVITIPAVLTDLRTHLEAKWNTNLIDGYGRTLHFGSTAYEATFAFGDASDRDTLRRAMATCAMMCYAYARYNIDTLGSTRPHPTHYTVEMAGHEPWTRTTHTSPAPIDPVLNAHLCSCATSDASDPAFVPPSGPATLAFTPATYGVGYLAGEKDYTGVASLRTAAMDDAFEGPDAGFVDRNVATNWVLSGQTDCDITNTAITVPAFAAVYHGHLGTQFRLDYRPTFVAATAPPAMYWHYLQQNGANAIDTMTAALNETLYYPTVLYSTDSPSDTIVPGECVCASGFTGRTCAVDMNACYWYTALFNGGDGPGVEDAPSAQRRLYSLRFDPHTRGDGTPYFHTFSHEFTGDSIFAHVWYSELGPGTDFADFLCPTCTGSLWGPQCQHTYCDPGDVGVSSAKCSSHGYCYESAGCRCDPGYTGDECETLDTTLAIGGTVNTWAAAGCFDTAGMFTYNAINGTTTPVPLNALFFTRSELCSGHGTCARDDDEDDVTPGACQCDDGYTGPFCAIDISECSDGAYRACRQVENPLSAVSPVFACGPSVVMLPAFTTTHTQADAPATCAAFGTSITELPDTATLSGHYAEDDFADFGLPDNYDVPATAAMLYCAVEPCAMQSAVAFTAALRATPVAAAVMFRPLIIDATYAASNDFRSRGLELWLHENFAAKGGDDMAVCGVPGWASPTGAGDGDVTLTNFDSTIIAMGGYVAAFDAAMRGVDPAEGRVDPTGATSTGPSGGDSSDFSYRERVFSSESQNFVTVEDIDFGDYYTSPVRKLYLDEGRLTATKPGSFSDIRGFPRGSTVYAGVLPVNWWVPCVHQNDSMTLGDLMDMHSDTLRVAPLAYATQS